MPAYMPKQSEGTMHIQAQLGPQGLAEARMEHFCLAQGSGRHWVGAGDDLYRAHTLRSRSEVCKPSRRRGSPAKLSHSIPSVVYAANLTRKLFEKSLPTLQSRWWGRAVGTQAPTWGALLRSVQRGCDKAEATQQTLHLCNPGGQKRTPCLTPKEIPCACCAPPDSSAPSFSTLAPVRHRWLPDKMAISSQRSIMWKHSNNLAAKHQLVNALVSHASAVRFLGVN